MKQGDAVFAAICAVMNQKSFDQAVTMTPEQKQRVYSILTEGFTSNKIALADTPANQEKLGNEKILREYVQGLTSNWMRKDKRLNGGIKYQPTNPGSRVGSGDEKLKALREVRKAVNDNPAKLALVDTAIEKRIRELAAEKVKKIDTTLIDPELAEALGFSTDEE
jgi:hypothetical protein